MSRSGADAEQLRDALRCLQATWRWTNDPKRRRRAQRQRWLIGKHPVVRLDAAKPWTAGASSHGHGCQLADAVDRFTNPSAKIRRESLEELWDAFERAKALEPPQTKPQSAEALLTRGAGTPEIKAMLEAEFRTLTNIGNAFMIRHTEVGKVPLDAGVDVDYLFHRLFSTLWRVMKATGRC